MECDYADHLDLDWKYLLDEQLKEFSCQNGSKQYSYDEVLEKVFSSEGELEQEVNYKDKEICEKCLIESLRFLSNRPVPPRQSQIRFLFKIAKYAIKDETCFINLNAGNILSSLIYVLEPSINYSEKEMKILFLEFLSSFLEHYSGVKGLIETNWWTYAYKLILENQNIQEDVSNLGYEVISKLLEKTLALNKDNCYKVMEVIAEPLLNAARLIEAQTTCTNLELIEELKPSILCLVNILEILLERYNAGVLNCLMKLKVDLASDTVSKTTNDKSVCLVLDQISLILSFFKLTDIFDGIKSISQDPLAVTGFLRIVETELNKGAIDLVFKLYYYSLKYIKTIKERIPNYIYKGRHIDIERELISFQLEPIILISEKLNPPNLLKQLNTDMVRATHLAQILQPLNVESLNVGLKVKEILPQYPFQIYTDAVKYIIQSRHLYSKEYLGTLCEGLIYSFQDTIDHIKSVSKRDEECDIGLQAYVLELLKAILLFIESFDLNWSDSVKILEITHILAKGCNSCQWPAQITVQVLKLLQKVISRRLSPTMSLLIDSDEDIREFGALMYQKCFTREWEVRKTVLEVVHTISISANKGFPSFKNLLIDASLVPLISTMALNDESPLVRAIAFKCLHEIIVMDKMDEILPRNPFIDKVLNVLMGNACPMVKDEAIKLIIKAYQDGLDDKVVMKAYKCLEHVALTSTDSVVQIQSLQFWCKVTERHLSTQGWMDKKFPAVTFSKRIVCMTNKEVRKRIYKVLSELRNIGCLNVFQKISKRDNLPKEALLFLNKCCFRFNGLFRAHDVTPESMQFNEEFPNFSPISSEHILPPHNCFESDSDHILDEIINDTVMKMMPDDIEFIQDEDLYPLMDSKYFRRNIPPPQIESVPQINCQITPSEFVDFVYKRIAYLVNREDGIDDYREDIGASHCCGGNKIDN